MLRLSSLKSSPLCRVTIGLTLAVSLLLSNVWPAANAADGDLDLSFGSGGAVTTDFFARRDEAVATALQTDGKILAAGVAQTGDEFSTSDFAVARYNPNGSLDLSFGSGGKVVTDFFSGPDDARSIAIQADGKIVLAGLVLRPQIGFNVGLVRYNTDGSLDPSFGVAGKVNTLVELGASASALAIQPDGRILAAGTVNLANGENDFLIARYNSDGNLDLSFGVGGVTKTDFFGINRRSFINSLVLQPDGKIVAGGLAEKTSVPFSFDFAITRYNSDGSLDSAFGTGGKVSVEFVADAMDQCEAVVLQSDGKIVAAGQVANESLTVVDFALARFNSDGSLDSTFGSGGKVTTDFFPGSFDVGLDAAIQPDGKIVVGGNFNSFLMAQAGQGLARYITDGSLDTAFGVGGKATGSFGPGAQDCRAIALQPDGRIVCAGASFGFGFQQIDFFVARYDGGGSEICVQDDSNGNLLQFNSKTGDYKFSNCKKGFMLTGRGAVSIRFCKVELVDVQRDRNISLVANTCTHIGTASVRDFSRNQTFTISDGDIRNNTCSCR